MKPYKLRGLTPAERESHPEASCVMVVDGQASEPLSREEAEKIIGGEMPFVGGSRWAGKKPSEVVPLLEDRLAKLHRDLEATQRDLRIARARSARLATGMIDLWEAGVGKECEHGVGYASHCSDDCSLETARDPLREAYALAGESTPMRTFDNLHPYNILGPVRFQGGVIFLRSHGCGNCGHAFWTEGDGKRRLPPGPHPCPHCGVRSVISDG